MHANGDDRMNWTMMMLMRNQNSTSSRGKGKQPRASHHTQGPGPPPEGGGTLPQHCASRQVRLGAGLLHPHPPHTPSPLALSGAALTRRRRPPWGRQSPCPRGACTASARARTESKSPRKQARACADIEAGRHRGGNRNAECEGGGTRVRVALRARVRGAEGARRVGNAAALTDAPLGCWPPTSR